MQQLGCIIVLCMREMIGNFYKFKCVFEAGKSHPWVLGHGCTVTQVL